MLLIVTAQLLVIGVTMTSGYPMGAPELACTAMDPTPCHGASPNTGPPPYKLTMSSTTYQPKQNITVTISSAGNNTFKGFLVEGRARTGNLTDTVGYFYNTTTAKNVCSYSKFGIGITQTDSHNRTSETFVWRAPDKTMGDLVFKYTIVRGNGDDASDFFKGMTSQTLTPARSAFDRVIVV